MTHNKKFTARALAVLAAASVGTAAAVTSSASAEALTCDISVRHAGGAAAVDAMVGTRDALTGAYELTVSGGSGSGSSDISQSGDFSLAAGEHSSVSSLTLAGDGGSYVAKLTVRAGGSVQHCTKRIDTH